MGMVKEFREFAVKGNVVDMAVGIIIGAAFGKIVTSAVNDLVMPPLGALIGGVNFTNLKLTLGSRIGMEPVTINYGIFIQTAVDFIVVAFAVFLLVKGINTLRRKQEAAPAPPPGPTVDQQLLTEIRDLLKTR